MTWDNAVNFWGCFASIDEVKKTVSCVLMFVHITFLRLVISSGSGRLLDLNLFFRNNVRF